MMRWAAVAIAACVVAVGCGDDQTGPSGQRLVFTAPLSPASEVPPVTNAESGGSGVMQVQFEGTTATFYFQLTGFPDDTTIVGAHIHPGAAGVNGPVILNTGIAASAPVAMPNGTVEFRATVPVEPSLVQAIAANPAGYYFNVHSPRNPGGFARGQLTQIR